MTVEFAANDLDRFVGIPEAAARLGIHEKTARRQIAAGAFPVPVTRVGGKQMVSLRRLVEFIHGEGDAA